MKLSQFKEDYQWFSGKASDVARQLAFGGIGIGWLFRSTGQGGAKIQTGFLLPTALFCSALACDLLQYLLATLIWGAFHRIKEKEARPGTDPEILAPPWFNYPGILLFWLKQIVVVAGYSLLIKHFWEAWFSR